MGFALDVVAFYVLGKVSLGGLQDLQTSTISSSSLRSDEEVG